MSLRRKKPREDRDGEDGGDDAISAMSVPRHLGHVRVRANTTCTCRSVSDLKAHLTSRGIPYRDCVEKSELVDRAVLPLGHAGHPTEGGRGDRCRMVTDTQARLLSSLLTISAFSAPAAFDHLKNCVLESSDRGCWDLSLIHI